MRSGHPAIARGLDRLDALCGGRTPAVADVRILDSPISAEPETGWRPVKGPDRLSGAWAARKERAAQAPLTGCRRPQECIQAIKVVSKAAARPHASSPIQDSKGETIE